jgi:hypothetical protein
MFPISLVKKISNSVVVNAIHSSYFSHWDASAFKRKDLFNGIFGQLAIPMTLPIRNIASAFRGSIEHIISLRSQKKVVRVYTTWVVALMKNVYAIFYIPVVQYPTNAMGSKGFPLNCKTTVSRIFPFCTNPSPAVRTDGDFRKESFLDLVRIHVRQCITSANRMVE